MPCVATGTYRRKGDDIHIAGPRHGRDGLHFGGKQRPQNNAGAFVKGSLRRRAGHLRRAARILDDQVAAAQILDRQFGRLLQGAGNVLGFAWGREGQEQGYVGVLNRRGCLLGCGIIAEQVADFRHATAAREQQDKKHGKQISPLPPYHRLGYTRSTHFATPTESHEATDYNPPPTL